MRPSAPPAILLAGLLGLVPTLLIGCRRGAARPPARAAAPLIRFTDVAQSAGLRYRWSIPGKRPLNILQTIGNGCAFLDYDQDGNLDVLLVGPKLALYRGNGQGHFTNVTHETGLDRFTGHFLGCAVGDYDNDGYPDLYISGYRTGLLLHNEAAEAFRRSGVQDTKNGSPKPEVRSPKSGLTTHDSRLTTPASPPHRFFRDVTRQSGLRPQPWGTSCAFAESIPGTGRLDLFVCNYLSFGPNTQPQLCTTAGGISTACGPRYYRPVRGTLWRNLGGGRFAGATNASGAVGAGKALGAAWADFDGSGAPGLAVANDEMPGDLFWPVRSGAAVRYRNISRVAGTAFDRDGAAYGGMGADWGDVDNDGRLDLFVASFQNEPKPLFHNDGNRIFSDIGPGSGIGAARQYVAFGCKLLDIDNDGWLDLVISNGHVQDNIAEIDHSTTYRQPTLLYHSLGIVRGTLRYEDVTAVAGPDLARPIVGRGLVTGDYDNDGRMDILVVDSEGGPLLLHNVCSPTWHWLGVRLIGKKSNRDGYGALLTAKAGGRTLTQLCHADGSYLSSSDSRVHFGVGASTKVEALTVRWPGGATTTYRNIPADRYITLREGDPRPE